MKRIIIPQGGTPEENKIRRHIIKDYYAQWMSEHPEKVIWNNSIHAFIHVKNSSVNEILGHASRSPKATEAQFRLNDILSQAILIKQIPLKKGNKNQRAFSQMYLLKWKNSRVLVGFQKSKGEYVLYYISGGQK